MPTKAASRNQARGFSDIALFEAGPVFSGGEPSDQDFQISGLLVGQTTKKNVHSKTRNIDIFDVKADVEATLAALGAPKKCKLLELATVGGILGDTVVSA